MAGAQGLPDVEVDVISSRVYTSAVDAFAEGRRDEGVRRLARVVPSAVHATARATFGTWTSAREERRWRAAAALHLDTAWALVQRYRADAVDPHLRAADLALDHLRAIDASPEAGMFRARCAVARLHHLTVAGRHDELDRSAAGLTVPDALQTDLLFARAVSHETRARAAPPRVDRRPSRATAPLAAATLAGTRRVWLDSHLRRAAELYRQVLTRDPAHVEARLRLGRVHVERADTAAAIETLGPLAVSGCRDTVCGLAWLAMGEVREALDDHEGARTAYREALGATGAAGPATVALLTYGEDTRPPADAHVAPAADGDSAVVPSGAPGTPPPAWRAYLLGMTARHEALMTSLREAVR